MTGGSANRRRRQSEGAHHAGESRWPRKQQMNPAGTTRIRFRKVSAFRDSFLTPHRSPQNEERTESTERLARTPNAVKNDAKLPCQRDARLANPGPLRNSLRPILQTRRLLDPRQDHDSRLVHQCADKRIATSRNPAATVDLPRLILPWCQPHVRADRPRSGKALRANNDETSTPPGSLDPQARKDPLAHAQAPHSERCRGGRRPGWRP